MSGKEKHINISTFPGLSRDWVGGKMLFTCFSALIPCGGEEIHINKISRKSQDNPAKSLFMCFFVCFLFRESFCESREGVRLPRERG